MIKDTVSESLVSREMNEPRHDHCRNVDKNPFLWLSVDVVYDYCRRRVAKLATIPRVVVSVVVFYFVHASGSILFKSVHVARV
jgi:hypothetical protein